MTNTSDLSHLATQLSELVLRGMGARSTFALTVGLQAAELGVGGVVALKIPRRRQDRVDVIFTAGDVDVLTTSWGQIA